MAEQPSTSRDSSHILTSSISSIEIGDNSTGYMYDSLGRLICNNNDHEQQRKKENRRSWSGYQTLPANFKQHHCHVSRRHGPITRRHHLSERSRSLTNSPVRVWHGCLSKPQQKTPRKNSVEYTNGTIDTSSQESISSVSNGHVMGCCGGHRRTVSESEDASEDRIKRSQTACTPISSLRARLKRSMSEGEPHGVAARRNSPIRLIPNPQGSLMESPRRLVRLRIKCDHASYPHQVIISIKNRSPVATCDCKISSKIQADIPWILYWNICASHTEVLCGIMTHYIPSLCSWNWSLAGLALSEQRGLCIVIRFPYLERQASQKKQLSWFILDDVCKQSVIPRTQHSFFQWFCCGHKNVDLLHGMVEIPDSDPWFGHEIRGPFAWNMN